jgi:molecular chaperone DnaJ
VKGYTALVNIQRNEKCTSCNGAQQSSNTVKVVCGTCNGKGKVASKLNGSDESVICDECMGLGEYRQACGTCKGAGFEVKTVKEKITVPKGVFDGLSLRLAGKGNWSPRGAQGDLLIKVKVRPHPFFGRKDSDTLAIKYITMT